MYNCNLFSEANRAITIIDNRKTSAALFKANYIFRRRLYQQCGIDLAPPSSSQTIPLPNDIENEIPMEPQRPRHLNSSLWPYKVLLELIDLTSTTRHYQITFGSLLFKKQDPWRYLHWKYRKKRISVIFASHNNANTFITHPILQVNNLKAFISKFQPLCHLFRSY